MNISRLDALIMEQEGLKSLRRSDVELMQLQKLNELLRRERERGGFYARLPEKLSELEALSTLPFTTDEDLAGNAGGLLLISQGDVCRVLSDATSGTTGRAKRVFYTAADCENTVRLFMAGLGELIGKDGRTMICMPFSGQYGLGELIAEAIERLGAKPLKLGAEMSYGELRRVMEREQPDSYVGMPTRLLSLLRVCGRGSLKTALISGDACALSVERSIEKLLGSRLYPHYGSREMCLGGAVTCQAHDGMHLRENHVIAEIVSPDGEVLPRGEYGELVITTIGREAMPLIRYKTGDYTRILPEECPCGSSLIRLDRIQRRESAITRLDEAIFALDAVADYRAALYGDSLELEVLTDDKLSDKELRAAVGRVLPSTSVHSQIRQVSLDDAPLYIGKRRIERQ